MPGSTAKPSLNGWQVLLSEYFEVTVVGALGDYFRAKGFQGFYEEYGCKVRFDMADVFVDISYLLETAPQYEIILTIGRSASDKGTGEWSLPLWFLIPEDHPTRVSPWWKFNSPANLEEVLLRIQEEVLIPFAEPLMSDHEALRLQMERYRKLSEEDQRNQYDGVALQRKQERLDALWNANDYRSFVKIFEDDSRINDGLPASVHMKYEIARKRMDGE